MATDTKIIIRGNAVISKNYINNNRNEKQEEGRVLFRLKWIADVYFLQDVPDIIFFLNIKLHDGCRAVGLYGTYLLFRS